VQSPGGIGPLLPASPGVPHRIFRFTGWLNINRKRSINLPSFTMDAGLADGEPDQTSLLGDSKDVLGPSSK